MTKITENRYADALLGSRVLDGIRLGITIYISKKPVCRGGH